MLMGRIGVFNIGEILMERGQGSAAFDGEHSRVSL